MQSFGRALDGRTLDWPAPGDVAARERIHKTGVLCTGLPPDRDD